MPSRFQSFDDPADPAATRPRLAALRAELARHGLDGVVVPRADRYQNEYVPPADERLAWLTGFTGSAGTAVVLADRAVLFVDGRYTLQAAEQVDPALFEIAHLTETPPSDWIEASLPAGARLGYDPWLHTVRGAEKLAAACEAAGGTLVPLAGNPIDAVWTDRPAPPLGPVVMHDTRHAGEPALDKLARLREALRGARLHALVVSDPHAVAWLFNIRGSDVAHTPLPLATAVVPVDGRAALYVDPRKVGPAVREALAGLADLPDPDAFETDLARLAASGAAVRIDDATGADAIARIVRDAGGKVSRGADPIALMKAVKNATEIDGARAAHRRDGVALVRFLAWLDGAAAGGTLTEIDAVEALEQFRADTGQLEDVSFPSIAGAGPNGAIVHYRVTRRTNRRLGPGELFLIDSGAQYVDGTTDVTRTVAIGPPTDEMRDRFTRVLKGHVAVARAVFPDGTTGAQLDSFARMFLWSAGLDFDHGTGHGIGSYLSVHEGPARISKLGTTPLSRGMILSDEPGYYRTGAYGIRIENLLLVTEAPAVAGAEKPLNAFETLTLAPIDLRLVAPALMSADEIAWLDAYHERVRETLSPDLDPSTRDWLAHATRPVAAFAGVTT
ncbi:aminopeptidase P family protein [Rhodoplanes sp. TEM]|uniref:Aminopeptidase P family protein n=1 Tax=Rhodoplanes tepidamans TaxID=200616 RepID=A0ABT5J7G8_RHOTP|nr:MULTISPECIES: aminopeptidase P family protein [Rhodoplanes]MDC7785331.1 aminopeptidase P family protein [Rhodoplanes tepidamans]MDC7986270.1 aminopeptidase P family protein [Rhodoplanes sp. TEM]MDQ0353218.1 Xaa-Pro aminopeptidase [Rhodoplanes tepidamans]